MEQQTESEKSRLRRIFSERRRTLDAETRERFDQAICSAVRGLPDYRSAECVGSFIRLGAEPDLSWLFQEKRVFLPRFNGARKCYDMVEVADPETQLSPGKYGIPEPCSSLRAAEPEFVRENLLFLVPAVACDRKGVRLGRGGGYYDRLLSGVRIPPVGVIYSCQMAEALPRAGHDCLMGVVVTETETVCISNTESSDARGIPCAKKGVEK